MNGFSAKKLKEAAYSTVPITLLVVVINFLTKPMGVYDFISFIFGAVLLTVGMWLYTHGVETSMTPIGDKIGAKITSSKKLVYILVMSFILGVIITIAEPDLAVLENQAGIKNLTLIIALGIGFFMLFAIIRIVFRIKLKYMLLGLYLVLFLAVAFAKEDVIPLAFDSGGATTGPITVPFIIALSAGITGLLGGSGKSDSEFGTIGICSVGPVLTVLIIGTIQGVSPSVSEEVSYGFASFGDVAKTYVINYPLYLKDVVIALTPIFLFFIIFQFASLRLNKKTLLGILTGLLFLVFGLSLFFTGVNIGFINTGRYIGEVLAGINEYLIIPIGMLVGAFIVLAEPAVHVLAKQVEEVTQGLVKSKTMLLTLAVANAAAIALAMFKIIANIPFLAIILPVYGLSLILMFIVPEVFTGIAFDSGGVASGPMATTFLLPFAIGADYALNGESASSGTFGIIAMVAMTPIFAIQLVGLVYKLKNGKKEKFTAKRFRDMLSREGDIIDLTEFSAIENNYKSNEKTLRSEIVKLKNLLEEKSKELIKMTDKTQTKEVKNDEERP